MMGGVSARARSNGGGDVGEEFRVFDERRMWTMIGRLRSLHVKVVPLLLSVAE